MPGLVPRIHVFLLVAQKKGVDGRDKPGRDDGNVERLARLPLEYAADTYRVVN
jgi:hypothetical protein